MGIFLAVTSGIGIFISSGVFAISLILKFVFLIAKKTEKKKKTSKVAKISAITFGVFLITFITTMIVAPKLDPVGWCSHEYKPVSRTEATCENSGELLEKCELCGHEKSTIIQINSHLWKEESIVEATCKTPKQILRKCEACGAEEITKTGKNLEHSWSEKETIDATCTNPKEVVFLCSVCEETKTIQEGEKSEHIFGEWIVEKEPSTEEKGKRYKICTVCDYTLSEKTLKISPVTILSRTYDIDFVGGVEWTNEIKNNSDRVIKYITLKWSCYNAVGDLIYDEITGKNNVGIKITGPLKSGETGRYTNASKFYNHSFDSSVITTIIVEYMDGEIVNITTDEYDNIFA